MTVYNTIIIGGGSSGLLSAIHLDDKKSILLEKNDILGKKILITGGGRCNITNNNTLENYVKSFYNGGNFYRTAFSNFFNKDIINLLEKNDCKTKVEENERVFPVSDKASTVQKTFTKILNNRATKYELNVNVKYLKKKNDLFIVKTNDSRTYKSKFVIIATGGNTYPQTGSTGDGYKFVEEFGHTITKQMGGLSPIKIKETWINNLQGIDIEVKLEIKSNKKSIVKDNGSIIFTHNGISGPVILNNSMEIEKYLRKNQSVIINLDFCEHYSYEELDNKLQEDFSKNSNKTIKTYLHNYLPKRMANEYLNYLNIDSTKILNQINKKERIKIRDSLKRLTLNVSEVLEKEAFVTNSGVKRNEIDPNTFESKLVENLFIVGELIEGCGISGGYNLQQAYSTGVLASKTILERILNDSY
ncbi:MAG: NAD(P)/FAD-dependent oxidoreductase [Methanosphaera stadtmanae]|nr:NAD(P)/FAD-dependent oxidoreductase [Methanosphaera stadtmanae]